jgi:hypothetical protein
VIEIRETLGIDDRVKVPGTDENPHAGTVS